MAAHGPLLYEPLRVASAAPYTFAWDARLLSFFSAG